MRVDFGDQHFDNSTHRVIVRVEGISAVPFDASDTRSFDFSNDVSRSTAVKRRKANKRALPCSSNRSFFFFAGHDGHYFTDVPRKSASPCSSPASTVDVACLLSGCIVCSNCHLVYDTN